MNVSILQENLLKALTRTGRVLSAKPQLPILNNVLLEAEKGRLNATTTSLDITEQVSVGAKTEKEGGICVSSKLLTELVSSLPREAVHLLASEGSLHVSSGGTTATIPGISSTEFPPVSTSWKLKKAVELDKTTFVRALDSVLFAAASDDGRPLLTGVKIKKQENDMIFAATDGYRLSVNKLDSFIKEPFDMLVPARALSEVVKTSQEEKDVKEVSLTQTEDKQLLLVVGDTSVTTRLIDGEYPSFEKIIPPSFTTRILFEKDQFTRAVKSAAIFARDNSNIVRLTTENQRVVVSANTPQVGENRVLVDAKVDGDGGAIAFNCRYLLDFLNNFTAPEFLFEMTGSLNPGVFKPVKDESFLHVIMPVRVQE